MLSVRRLSRRFQVAEGTVNALKELSFTVEPGEFFVLVGASGSGKTTLLRCIAGLDVPDGGEVRIDGRIMSSDAPPTFVPPQQRRLGMVFQSYAVWPHLTVYENVALPLKEGTQRIARGEVDRQVRQVLEMVELESLAHRSATLLSGGQQQRVALARAIAVNSRMILMDEPLSNLDARLREEVRDRIRELAKRLGSTVVYVTHDQVEAMAMADRIALLRLGELLQVGTPVDLYRHPREPFIAEFFGQVNWLEGRSLGADRVETPIGDLRVAARAPAGQRVLLGIRPECLAPVENDAVNTFEARLISSVFLGDQVHGHLAIAEQVLSAKGRALLAPPGSLVRVAIDPADVMLFESHAATALEPVLTPA